VLSMTESLEVEWPEIVTEGKDIEECRAMLTDALHEVILTYNELGRPIL
jgi:predicted RNase H-like HicB family nuclease